MNDKERQVLFADDELSFSDEITEDSSNKSKKPPWKIIIADDHDEIHSVTKLVLEDFSFQGRSLQLISAFSGEETIRMFGENPDVALILLDVVMEEDDTGLQVVRYIREELNNNIVQIVLNTGQPGQAPEQEVIAKYDINDYKSKTEFNARKLFTCVTASLRAFSLSQSYDQANKKLSQYQNHLEDLVKERTLELEKANNQLKQEIEDKIRAEKALQQNNETLNHILAASPVGICQIEDARIKWVNEELLNIFGFHSETECAQKSLRLFFPSDEAFDHAVQLVENKFHDTDSFQADVTLTRKDRSEFTGHLMISSSSTSNPMQRAIMTITDVTWRKQAEEDRQQAERLQGALEMAGGICHELNQPLQYISGSTEMILMDLSPDDQLYNAMRKIKGQVDRMGSITKKLMGITRYKTREYIGGKKIIDIDQSSKIY